MDPMATDGNAPAGPLDAQLEAILGPAVRAAVQAAARAAQEEAGAGGNAETASLEQALQPLVGVLKEVSQAVHSLEGQLVRVAEDCTQRLEDGIKRVGAGIAPAYNQAAHAHNQKQRSNRNYHRGILPLLPLRNSKGELPPAGLFPSTVPELDELLRAYYMCTSVEELEEHSARLARLLHFYGATPKHRPKPNSQAELSSQLQAQAAELEKLLGL